MDSMRLSGGDEDDHFLDDEEYDDGKPARKGFFGKKDEDLYKGKSKENKPTKPRLLSRDKVVPMKQRINMKISMVKPTFIEGAKEICDCLLVGKAIVLNMEGLHTEIARRIIDFTSGTAYSMNGDLQKIPNYIFVVTPESAGLSGDFQDLFGGGSLDISGMSLRI